MSPEMSKQDTENLFELLIPDRRKRNHSEPESEEEAPRKLVLNLHLLKVRIYDCNVYGFLDEEPDVSCKMGYE